jgi:hypothetical protein
MLRVTLGSFPRQTSHDNVLNRAAFLCYFSVELPNSHWHIEAEGQSDQPAYSGSTWIDKENYRVLRIELSA